MSCSTRIRVSPRCSSARSVSPRRSLFAASESGRGLVEEQDPRPLRNARPPREPELPEGSEASGEPRASRRGRRAQSAAGLFPSARSSRRSLARAPSPGGSRPSSRDGTRQVRFQDVEALRAAGVELEHGAEPGRRPAMSGPRSRRPPMTTLPASMRSSPRCTRGASTCRAVGPMRQVSEPRSTPRSHRRPPRRRRTAW